MNMIKFICPRCKMFGVSYAQGTGWRNVKCQNCRRTIGRRHRLD